MLGTARNHSQLGLHKHGQEPSLQGIQEGAVPVPEHHEATRTPHLPVDAPRAEQGWVQDVYAVGGSQEQHTCHSNRASHWYAGIHARTS